VIGKSSLLLCFQFLQDAVKDTVDKLSGLFGAESLRQVDRFVNRNSWWRVGIEDLEGAQPQDVSVRDRHALQAPVVRALGDHWIQFTTIATDAAQQGIRECDEFIIVAQSAAQEPFVVQLIMAGIDVVPVKDLKDNFSRSASSSHKVRANGGW